MTARLRPWTIRLTASAEEGFRAIVRWTRDRFGERQALVYSATVSAALMELRAGPEIAGIKTRDDIAKGILTLHVARHGRRGRHFVMLRVAGKEERVLEVLRLLHDAMDLPQHLPEQDRD